MQFNKSTKRLFVAIDVDAIAYLAGKCFCIFQLLEQYCSHGRVTSCRRKMLQTLLVQLRLGRVYSLRPTLASPAPCGVHLVEGPSFYRSIRVCVDTLLLWLLGWPILCQFASFELQPCNFVPQVMELCQGAHNLLHLCLRGDFKEELILIRILHMSYMMFTDIIVGKQRACQAYTFI
jgi:hypothetical protein